MFGDNYDFAMISLAAGDGRLSWPKVCGQSEYFSCISQRLLR